MCQGDGDQGERRRSVRAKRDKPGEISIGLNQSIKVTNIFEDYYDALDYDSKRQKGPRTPGERTPGAQKRGSFSGRGSLGSAQVSRGPQTAGQFSVKLLFKNFPVVILCIGIILVFQNIIHGGW